MTVARAPKGCTTGTIKNMVKPYSKLVRSTVRRSGARFACLRTFVLVSLLRCRTYTSSLDLVLSQVPSGGFAPHFISQLTQFIRGAVAPPWGVRSSITTAYTPPGARRGGSACPMSHTSPQRPGKAPTSRSHLPNPPPPDAEGAAGRLPRSMGQADWEVYEVDPLVCPHYGSQMELIAVITDPSGTQDLTPPAQNRKGTAGTRSQLPDLRPRPIPRPATGDAQHSLQEKLSTYCTDPQPGLINGRLHRPAAAQGASLSTLITPAGDPLRSGAGALTRAAPSREEIDLPIITSPRALSGTRRIPVPPRE